NFRFRQLLIGFFLLFRLPLAQLFEFGLGSVLLPGQSIHAPLQSSGLTLCWRQLRLLRLLCNFRGFRFRDFRRFNGFSRYLLGRLGSGYLGFFGHISRISKGMAIPAKWVTAEGVRPVQAKKNRPEAVAGVPG